MNLTSSEFNAGSYADSVASKNAAENITMVLYPNAETENGQELRLKPTVFPRVGEPAGHASQLGRVAHGDDFAVNYAAKNCFQLNDTHPAIAVAELMRLLLDEYMAWSWDDAWDNDAARPWPTPTIRLLAGGP